MKFRNEEIELIVHILSFLYIEKGILGYKHGLDRFIPLPGNIKAKDLQKVNFDKKDLSQSDMIVLKRVFAALNLEPRDGSLGIRREHSEKYKRQAEKLEREIGLKNEHHIILPSNIDISDLRLTKSQVALLNRIKQKPQ